MLPNAEPYHAVSVPPPAGVLNEGAANEVVLLGRGANTPIARAGCGVRAPAIPYGTTTPAPR